MSLGFMNSRQREQWKQAKSINATSAKFTDSASSLSRARRIRALIITVCSQIASSYFSFLAQRIISVKTRKWTSRERKRRALSLITKIQFRFINIFVNIINDDLRLRLRISFRAESFDVNNEIYSRRVRANHWLIHQMVNWEYKVRIKIWLSEALADPRGLKFQFSLSLLSLSCFHRVDYQTHKRRKTEILWEKLVALTS